MASQSSAVFFAECPLAARIPKAKKTGNLAIDQDAELARQAFVDTVNGMWIHDDLCVKVSQYFRSAVVAKEQALLRSQTGCFTEVSIVRKLDSTFMIRFIVTHSKLTAATLAKAKIADGDAVLHTFCFMTNMGPGTKVPEACIEVMVMWQVAVKLWENAGRRFESLRAEEYLDQNGRVSWPRIGSYELKFCSDDFRVQKIRHRPSGDEVEVDNATYVTNAHKLKNNWNDQTACAKLKNTLCFVDCFVDPNAWVKKNKTLSGKSKLLIDLAQEIVRVAAAEQAERDRKAEEDKARFGLFTKFSLITQSHLKAIINHTPFKQQDHNTSYNARRNPAPHFPQIHQTLPTQFYIRR